uniref:Putative ixodes 10 kDa peptide protein n=1 Tax=Ixodes ricinus TaxID=34613 RepID=A0A0K8RCC8_IXORI
MCRNISNMLFVLFAVVLILPAFQGEGVLSGMIPAHHCQRGIDPAGQIFCQLSGLQDLTAYHLRTCEVRCLGSARKLRLPTDVCPRSGLVCTENLKQNLLKWRADMLKIKMELTNDWCRK